MRQTAIFSCGEGDAWHSRNEYAKTNPIVVRELLSVKGNPQTIVEIGCGDGRYLHEMEKHYACHCIGYDPSLEAITSGTELYPELELRRGTHMSFSGLTADIFVFGFCLYLVDRHDLLRLVADTDWSLRNGSHLIIHDFDPDTPTKTPYHHKEGVFSYKMDYSKLWLANPSYRLVSKATTRDGEAVTTLQKGEW